jgi:hypothetical protein
MLEQVYTDYVTIKLPEGMAVLSLPHAMSALQTLSADRPAELAAAAAGDAPDPTVAQQEMVLGALPRSSGAAHVLRPQAAIANGALTGYQVYPVNPDKLGINSGDELVAINGQLLNDAQSAAAVFESLDAASDTAVDLSLKHLDRFYRVTVDAELLRRHRR